jgi:flagellar hook-length control protein FliK
MTVAEQGAAANLDSQAQGPSLAQPQGQAQGQTLAQSAATIAKGQAQTQPTGAKEAPSGAVTATQGQSASAQTAAAQTATAQTATDAGSPDAAPAATVDAAAQTPDPSLAAQSSSPDPSAAGGLTASAPVPLQAAAATAQAGPETVARLATQIVQTAQGPASEFNLTLHPAELGGVQVKIQVDKNGQVRAALSFDNPQSAADLSAHADDLRAQLSQAGFDVADGGLSFSLNGQGQQAFGDNSGQAGLMGGRAFRAAAAGAEDLLTQLNEAASRLARTSTAASGGLDIRI